MVEHVPGRTGDEGDLVERVAMIAAEMEYREYAPPSELAGLDVSVAAHRSSGRTLTTKRGTSFRQIAEWLRIELRDTPALHVTVCSSRSPERHALDRKYLDRSYTEGPCPSP